MKSLLLTVFLLITCSIYAQPNYQPGYIIKTNGDTVKGYIDQREWNLCPLKISFRAGTDDKIEDITPTGVISFNVNNITNYISFKGHLSADRNEFSNLPPSRDTSTAAGTVFLEQISTGKFVTLYSHADHLKRRFFIQEKGHTPQELKYYRYYNPTSSITTESPYKSKLAYLVSTYRPGNVSLSQQINRTDFEASDLARFVRKLNQLEGTEVKKRISSYFVGAGVSRNVSKFQGIYKIVFQPSTNYCFKLNTGVDTYINPYTRRLIFRGELGVSYISPTFKTAFDEYYTFNQYTATLYPQIIYNLHNKVTFKAYLGVGLAYNFSTYSNNKFVGILGTQSDYFSLESSFANFPIKVGAFIKNKTEFSLTYLKFSRYTRNDAYAIGVETISLSVHRFLGKKRK
ncbi:MAG TPA: hypothetical protein VF602_05605 [Pedobacter sp.]|jgi:hypothetical protein